MVHAILDEFTTNIANVVNNVCLSFDPEVIIFTSFLLEEIPSLLIDIKHKTSSLTIRTTPLEISNNSKYATQLGGYALLLRHFFNLENFDLHLKI